MVSDNATIIGGKLPGYVYPERYCSYCEHQLWLEQVVHMSNPVHYKAVFMCRNTKCGAYDEEGHKAFVKVYYSSNEAEASLWDLRIWMPRPKKQ